MRKQVYFLLLVRGTKYSKITWECNDFNIGVIQRHESPQDDVRSRVMGQGVDGRERYVSWSARSSDLTNLV